MQHGPCKEGPHPPVQPGTGRTGRTGSAEHAKDAEHLKRGGRRALIAKFYTRWSIRVFFLLQIH